jgi:hypothetical protein
MIESVCKKMILLCSTLFSFGILLFSFSIFVLGIDPIDNTYLFGLFVCHSMIVGAIIGPLNGTLINRQNFVVVLLNILVFRTVLDKTP